MKTKNSKTLRYKSHQSRLLFIEVLSIHIDQKFVSEKRERWLKIPFPFFTVFLFTDNWELWSAKLADWAERAKI